MIIVKEYIKSEDVLTILYNHKYDHGKGKFVEDLYNEILAKLILETI